MQCSSIGLDFLKRIEKFVLHYVPAAKAAPEAQLPT